MSKCYIVKEGGGLYPSVYFGGEREDGNTMVRVGEKEGLPIYKLVDISRENYDRNKKQKKQALQNRKATRSSDIYININIGLNDLNTKLRKGCKSLSKGNINKANLYLLKKHRGRRTMLSLEEYHSFMEATLRPALDSTGYKYETHIDERKKKYLVQVWR